MFSFNRSLIALVGLFVIVGALVALLPHAGLGQEDVKNPLKRDPRKSYYLTQSEHNGVQAPSACVEGYHMASLWEIFDTSNLRYNTALGFTQADSGFGPPVARSIGPPNPNLPLGWVRTGGAEASGPEPGFANCSAYTTADDDRNGTAITLVGVWNSTEVTVISPWRAIVRTCDTTMRVWCVQD